jgi:hypothetical protein
MSESETSALGRWGLGPMERPMLIPASFSEAERLLRTGTRLTPEQLASLLGRKPGTAIPDVLVSLYRGHVARRAFASGRAAQKADQRAS